MGGPKGVVYVSVNLVVVLVLVMLVVVSTGLLAAVLGAWLARHVEASWAGPLRAGLSAFCAVLTLALAMATTIATVAAVWTK